MRPSSSGLAQWVLFVVLALGLGGCAGLSGILRDSPDLAAERLAEPPPSVSDRVEVLDTADLQTAEADRDLAVVPDRTPLTVQPTEPSWPASPATAADPEAADAAPEIILVAEADAAEVAQQRTPSSSPPPDVQIEEYDPWEPFNEGTFEFNRWLDRWILKPVAKGYRKVMPELFQEMIGNGFDNIRVVPRFVNCVFQGKFGGAGREVGRLVINSTLGIAGLFDPARLEFGIQKCNEDTGQTLGVWGFGPGPYLILPFLPPLTVRDAVGYVADGAMDPLNYFLPFIWDRFGMKAGDTVNDRALNIDLYQGFEEATVELYSALRNAYLQRRQKLISE
ncbi:MAG: VacJ family lipoprotein [Candidatus Rokubacteria bacterium]|nr:VacJ family lipoprotein [Candidatus Rokubacteria bacterium]